MTLLGIAMAHTIKVIGLGDRRPSLGFPEREDLQRFIEKEIVTQNLGRFHYTKNVDGAIFVLSWGGWACGHFVIQSKVDPLPNDLVDYPGTKIVYLVGRRALYSIPVRLSVLGIRVSQAPRDIDEDQFESILKAAGQVTEFFDEPTADSQRQRVLREIEQRLGQGIFRERVLAAYENKCAITGFDVEQCLDAAHIVAYCEGGSYQTSNGLLLRSDIHNLFDFNLLAIHPDTRRVHLAPKLFKTRYGELENIVLREPINFSDKPTSLALSKRWMIFESNE